MLRKTLLIIGLTALMVAQVHAQSTQADGLSMSLGPQVGYYRAQDADDGDFMGGVAWRLRFTPVLGVEASINYRQETYADGGMTVRSWPVMVSGLIHVLPPVYGAIGAGWYHTTFDFDQDMFSSLDDETKHQFGWHFGVGMEQPVSSNFKLTGDIRYVFLDYDFEEIPGRGDLNSNFYVITVGFLVGL